MSLRCVYGKDITPEMILEAVKIDNEIFRDISPEKLDTYMLWLKQSPDIYTMVLDDDKVVGYINAMPTTRQVIDLLRDSFKMDATDTYPYNILSYSDPEMSALYIHSIAVHPSYQDNGTIDFLLGKFFMRLAKTLGNKAKALTFLACVISEDGEKLCNKLGLVRVIDYGKIKVYEG